MPYKNKEDRKAAEKRLREKRNEQARQRYALNPDPKKNREKKKYKNNPDKIKNRHLLKNYGMSREQYDQMLADQDNKCAICFRVLIRPFVDHNHESGKAREILCTHCNTAIGAAGENVVVLERMIFYLNKHRGDANGA